MSNIETRPLLFPRSKSNQNNPDQESSDMSEPCHTTSDTNIQHLRQKPNHKEKCCGNWHDSNEEKQKDQSQNPSSRIQYQISAQHAGNCTTGSNHRNLGIGIEKNMSQTGPQS